MGCDLFTFVSLRSSPVYMKQKITGCESKLRFAASAKSAHWNGKEENPVTETRVTVLLPLIRDRANQGPKDTRTPRTRTDPTDSWTPRSPRTPHGPARTRNGPTDSRTPAGPARTQCRTWIDRFSSPARQLLRDLVLPRPLLLLLCHIYIYFQMVCQKLCQGGDHSREVI